METQKAEMGFVEELAKLYAKNRKEMKIEPVERLKKLETEHLANIDRYLKQLEKLRENHAKLSQAINLLKEINLEVYPEYLSKLNSYSNEIKQLEIDLAQEQNFLNYLRNRVLPLI
ncbi:MAG: hypothetical protein QXJ68_02855 [Methanocellales archaeon]